jgi:hypothetical protein
MINAELRGGISFAQPFFLLLLFLKQEPQQLFSYTINKPFYFTTSVTNDHIKVLLTCKQLAWYSGLVSS